MGLLRKKKGNLLKSVSSQRDTEEHERNQPPEEFAGLKRQITERSSGVEDVIRLLRGLKALEREGVLTGGEFNIDMWDILARRLLRKD